MNEELRSLARELRDLPSEAAADHLLNRYPPGGAEAGTARELIARLSWSKRDQVRLAQEYLKSGPFAAAKPYKTFAQMMPLRRLLPILASVVPESEDRRDLFLYHVAPVLREAVKTPSEVQSVNEFVREVEERG